ncbi:heptosyltransferase [Geomonas silvestris]|uniref:Heptosyltransferase n=1 Tax=Geomonas silvestris TaxID=2740184 RepID=A0A6V8MD54_9BACT|nr:glycosyltransferase family 9 protein [Geomonas silvestris]GFO57940.1 heptosyltransferase [Geomonas silvestris]
MQTKLLKLLDQLLGAGAAACLPAAASRPLEVVRRILVIRPGGIGDAVLLAPALVALKKRFPEAELTLLAERRNGGAFRLCPQVDRLLLYDRPADLLEVLRGGFDVIIDTEQWHRLSAVVARLARAPLSIGYATNDRKRLFSHGVPYSQDDYEAFSFFNLLAPLGISAPESLSVPFLTIPGEAASRAEALLGGGHDPRLVTVFPGASIPERRWGAARFAELAQRLTLAGCRIAVVGGPGDRGEGETIVAGCGGLNLAGRTSLVDSAAVIAQSRLLISGDSGILHIAVGLGIPTVSLFGPGIEAKWGPRGLDHRIVNLHLACSPCTRFGTTPHCPDGARCLSEISVAEVIAAAQELLS